MALEQHATTQNMFLKLAHTNVFHATRTTLLPRARFVFTGQHMIHMYDGGRTSISCGPHKHMLSEDREVTARRWMLAKTGQKPLGIIHPLPSNPVTLQVVCKRHTQCRCWVTPTRGITAGTRERLLHDLTIWTLSGDYEDRGDHQRSMAALQKKWGHHSR